MFRLVVATLAALMALPPAALAQAKLDLSGTWTLDEASSDPPPARSGGFGRGDRGGGDRAGRGRGRGGGRMGGFAASAMTIKQTASQISIERTTPMGAQTAVYKLDGSESLNDTPMGRASSSVSWDGPRLVIATTQKMQGRGGGEMEIESREIYSRDGDALRVDVSRTTPMGSQTRKLVYKRS